MDERTDWSESTDMGELTGRGESTERGESTDWGESTDRAETDGMAEPDVLKTTALTTKAAILSRIGNYRGALNVLGAALELIRFFFGENEEFAACEQSISEVSEMLRN